MASPVCNYDIVMIDKPWLPHYTSQEFLYELRRDLGQDMLKQYPEVIRKSFSPYDKRRCVLPVISSIQAIYYRKDWFEDLDTKAAFQGQYGVPLALPRSWKEYNMICEFLPESSTRIHRLNMERRLTARISLAWYRNSTRGNGLLTDCGRPVGGCCAEPGWKCPRA